jgi:hypothetical protein
VTAPGMLPPPMLPPPAPVDETPIDDSADYEVLDELAAYQPSEQSYVDPLIEQLSPGMAQILASLPQPSSIHTEGKDTAEGFPNDGAPIDTPLLPNDSAQTWMPTQTSPPTTR